MGKASTLRNRFNIRLVTSEGLLMLEETFKPHPNMIKLYSVYTLIAVMPDVILRLIATGLIRTRAILVSSSAQQGYCDCSEDLYTLFSRIGTLDSLVIAHAE